MKNRMVEGKYKGFHVSLRQEEERDGDVFWLRITDPASGSPGHSTRLSSLDDVLDLLRTRCAKGE